VAQFDNNVKNSTLEDKTWSGRSVISVNFSLSLSTKSNPSEKLLTITKIHNHYDQCHYNNRYSHCHYNDFYGHYHHMDLPLWSLSRLLTSHWPLWSLLRLVIIIMAPVTILNTVITIIATGAKLTMIKKLVLCHSSTIMPKIRFLKVSTWSVKPMNYPKKQVKAWAFA